MYTITIINTMGEQCEYTLENFGKTNILLGRDSKISDIVLQDELISNEHGNFILRGSEVYYLDAKSRNGSTLERDGKRYPLQNTDRAILLRDRDILRLGSLDNTGRQVLILLSSKNTSNFREDWSHYALSSRPVHIGSNPACLIKIGHPAVQNIQCTVEKRGQSYVVSDNLGPIPTLVNGEPVTGTKVLQEKDVIQILSTQIIYSNNCLFYRSKQEGVGLQAVNITKVVSSGKKLGALGAKKKKILDDVSLEIQPNQFIAIVGGSGAGKTTIMNALSGFDPDFTGTVLCNGMNLVENFDTLKSKIGFVPQEDILYETLALDTMLESTARLRMPAGTSNADIKRRVDEVLEMVELTEHKKTIIKKLSGGQKKRASIAVELLSDPKLFFLDEPTSGLDPGTEKSLMDTLNRLAKKEHKTIIMVTHNINNLEICDQVIIMAPGGRLAFMGPVMQAKTYFNIRKLCDVYDLLAEDKGGIWPIRWREAHRNISSRSNSSYDNSALITPQKDSVFRQFGILLRRYFALMASDRFKTLLLILQPVIIALLLGLVSSEDIFSVYNDTKSMMFSLSCAGIWLGLFDTIQEICKERVILKREYMNKLKLPAYMAAKFVVYALVALVQAVLLVVVYLQIIGSSPEGIFFSSSWLDMTLLMFLTILAAQAFGFMVSSVSPTGDKAMTYAPFILIIQLLFSGILFELSGPGVWISWLTISKWSVEGLGALADLNNLPTSIALEYPNFPMEQAIEEAFNHTAGNLTLMCLVLAIMTLVCLAACGGILTNVKKDRR